MIVSLDHLVVLVRDLRPAVSEFEGAGFRVTPGGEHADGLTRNALVPFADGTYLEIVEFVDPSDDRENVWGWRAFLPLGGGLVDHCALSDDLAADARRLRKAGFEVDGPDEGGRRLPDGSEIRWKSARVRQEGRVMPFLIEDVTPRETRVPGGEVAEHPNGATGIRRLQIAVHNAALAADDLAVLAASEPEEGTLRLGGQGIVVATQDDSTEAAERMEILGPGPFAVDLKRGGRGGGTGHGTVAGVRMGLV